MSGLNWGHFTADGVLDLGIWVLMVLMMIGLAVWFVCSIAENTTKMRRRIGRSNHDALLRENERLRDSLANAQEENEFLRKLYRELPTSRADDEGRNAA